MTEFSTVRIPAQRTEVAPDGSDVRVLARLPGGSMAHFELAAGHVSRAVTHRTVDEIWFVAGGTGEMWRRQGSREETVELVPGTCVTIPAGTHFQFRADAAASLAVVGVTMPPWPGDDEVVIVRGPWVPTVGR